MRQRLWSFTILLFLCTAFSAKAQSPSPAMQAVRYERLLFEGASPADANAALIGRARCLISLKRWGDALDALDRLRLYAMAPEDFLEANYLKALCKYRSGDYQGAAAHIVEGFPDTPEALKLRVLALAGCRRFDEAAALFPSELFSRPPVKKNETLATALSLLPPAGQLYTRADGAFPAAGLAVAGAALMVWQVMEGCWLTAIIGGGTLLKRGIWDMSVAAAPRAVEEYNSAAMEKFLKELETALVF